MMMLGFGTIRRVQAALAVTDTSGARRVDMTPGPSAPRAKPRRAALWPSARCAAVLGLAVWVCLAGALPGAACAQPTIWNSFQGAGSPVELTYAIPADAPNGDGVNKLAAYLAIPNSSNPVPSHLAPVAANMWTLDTGSNGVVITADLLYNSFGISAAQLTQIKPGQIKYTSSGLTYSGFYANLDVGMYNATHAGTSAQLGATAQVPVLVATSLIDKKNVTTNFCPNPPGNCPVVGAKSLEQFGVGFGRGSGPTAGWSGLNPLLNLVSVQSGNLATMAPGYVVTPSGIVLGLNAKQLSNSLLVQLQAVPQTTPTSQTNAYAVAATKSDWQTPPMLLSITNNTSPYAAIMNGHYYGTMLVDTGITGSILTNGQAPGSGNNPSLNQALITSNSVTSMMLSLPGMTVTGGPQPGAFTYIYQGYCTTASTQGCGPKGDNYNGGNVAMMVPIYPTSSGDTQNNGYNQLNTGFADTSGSTAFLNTGINFLNYFNIVYDPVSGLIGYQPNNQPYAATSSLPVVAQMLALQGTISIPDGTSVGLPVFLYTDIGNQTTQSLVPVNVTLAASTPSGVVTFEQPIGSDSIFGCTAANCSTGVAVSQGTFIFDAVNIYAGQTTINPGATLALGAGGNIAASSGLTANGTFDISGTTAGATVTNLAGTGTVALGSWTLTVANANGGFGGVIADGGGSGGIGGGLSIAGGTQTLKGVNTYTGPTTIAPGATLALIGTGSIAASSGVTAGGVFDIAGTSAGATIASLNGGGMVNLGSQTLQISNAAGAFSGIIGGSGGLALNGGAQTLTGQNTYTGGTRITGGGTLSIESDAALGAASGALSLNNGGLLALDSFTSNRSISVGDGGGLVGAGTSSVTLAGPITGSGLLMTQGSVMLSGPVSLTSLHVVNDGETAINGRLSAATVFVTETGTLRGTGTVAASLLVNGRLAPGNSPGTLTVSAPVTLTSGSVSAFDIDGAGTGTGAGNHSRLIVTGAGNTITLGGTLAPVLRGITGSAANTYTPPLGQLFQVITAQGGVIGTYGGLAQPDGIGAGTRFDALYGTNTVTLAVTPAAYGNLGLAGIPQTANQTAIGVALDSARPTAGVAMTGPQSSLYAPLYTVPGAAIPVVLEQLAPTIYGDALMARRNSWYLVSGAIDEQLSVRRGLKGARTAQSITDPGGRTVWLAGLGQFSNVASNNTAGYSKRNWWHGSGRGRRGDARADGGCRLRLLQPKRIRQKFSIVLRRHVPVRALWQPARGHGVPRYAGRRRLFGRHGDAAAGAVWRAVFRQDEWCGERRIRPRRRTAGRRRVADRAQRHPFRRNPRARRIGRNDGRPRRDVCRQRIDWQPADAGRRARGAANCHQRRRSRGVVGTSRLAARVSRHRGNDDGVTARCRGAAVLRGERRGQPQRCGAWGSRGAGHEQPVVCLRKLHRRFAQQRQRPEHLGRNSLCVVTDRGWPGRHWPTGPPPRVPDPAPPKGGARRSDPPGRALRLSAVPPAPRPRDPAARARNRSRPGQTGRCAVRVRAC